MSALENGMIGNLRREQKIQVKSVSCPMKNKESAGVIQGGPNPGDLGSSPASATRWVGHLKPLTTSLDLSFLRGVVWAR